MSDQSKPEQHGTESVPEKSEKGMVTSAVESGKEILSSVVKTGEEIVHYTTEKVGELVGSKKEDADAEPSQRPTPKTGIFGTGMHIIEAATTKVSGMLGFIHESPKVPNKTCKNPDCACVDCKAASHDEKGCNIKSCACSDCHSGSLKNTKCQNPTCPCENCQCDLGTCTCGK